MPSLSKRFQSVILIVISVAILSGFGVLLLYRPTPSVITILPPPPSSTPIPTLTPGPTPTPGPIKIYITGAVVDPTKVVVLLPNSRVEVAIQAAGGFAQDADRSRVNLAAILYDGDQVNVARLPGSRPGTDTPLPTRSGPVRINIADVTELQRLPGVGPVLAQRIIDYRTQNGNFRSFEDLDKVSGIGQATLERWRLLIIFG